MTKPLAIGFDVPFEEAISAAVSRGVVLPDVYYGELQGVARQLAFSIAGIAAHDQLQAVRDSLTNALTSGQSFNSWKKSAAAQNLGLPNHRLDNIWRTNLQGSYQRGRWEQITQNAELAPYVMYDAINDSRVRPSHLAMDGVIRRWDDPWWKTRAPPNGYRCRCSVVTLTESDAMRRSDPGRGLNKIPHLENGIPADPDPGWDYNPFGDELAKLEQLVAERNMPPPMAWADKVTKNQDRKIAYHAGLRGVSADEIAASLQSDIEQGMQGQSVWVSGTREMIADIIADGEIPQARASLVASLADLQSILRFDFEKKILGEEVRGEGITYGYLSGRQFGTLKTSLTMGDISIKLRPNVINRTRIASAVDMFNMDPSTGVVPSPMTAPSWRSARISGRPDGLPDLKNLDDQVSTWSAMVQGKVQLGDIEKIVFETKPSKALQRELDRAKIAWEVAPVDYDPLGPLNDELPFAEHENHRVIA